MMSPRFILLLLALLFLPACTTPAGLDLAPAVDDYENQRYQRAFTRSTRVFRATSGVAQAEAGYLSGLAAYELGRYNQAEERLLVAAESRDRETAGKANALLGVIHNKQNRPLEAARYFSTASRKLTGEESARAAYEGGQAHQAAGDMSAARAQFMIAAGRSTQSERRSNALAELDQTGFALQFGAFQKESNARNAAEELSGLDAVQALGPVRIITSRDPNGRTWHLVRAGAFSTRQAAAAARRRVGRTKVIVVAMEMK